MKISEQKAEAVIAFFDVEDSYRAVAALMQNNFACRIINDDFLLQRGFRPEDVADHGFADFGMKWIVASTTTRLDDDAFTAWVKSIVGPLGGDVEEAGLSPCDLLNPLLNPRDAQPAAIEPVNPKEEPHGRKYD